MNQTIQAQSQNTPFKFLGCWFTAALKYTTQTKLIQQEALGLNNILKTKNITNKQVAYIINTVIIPTLEYRIHNIVLPYTTCNYILSQYLTTAKHKAKLPVSIPNSTLLNHNIYGIKNIWEIQVQHHISKFHLRINDPNLMGTSTHIRLQ